MSFLKLPRRPVARAYDFGSWDACSTHAGGIFMEAPGIGEPNGPENRGQKWSADSTSAASA